MSDVQSSFHRIQLVRKKLHRIYQWRKQATARRETHYREQESRQQGIKGKQA